VLPAALLTQRVGAPDPAQRLDVDVVLADPNTAAERATAAAVVDPNSPKFHHFLTTADYGRRFGVAAATRAAVTSWLRRNGLDVGPGPGGSHLIAAAGTVAQLDRLFDLRLGTYRSGPTQFLANDTAPRVPADLPITDVIGLNDLQHFTVPNPTHRGPAARTQLGAFAAQLDVRSLWHAYDAPDSDTGQGMHAGVFMAGNADPVIGSLRVFEETEQLPRVPVRVVRTQPGRADEYGGNDGGEEWMLDTQSSTGLAPGMSDLSLYTAKNLDDPGIVGDFAYWAADPTGPLLMNASFGSCEAFPVNSNTTRDSVQVEVGNDIQDTVEHALMQAFTEGRTLFAASGDTGSSCPVVALPVVGAGNGVANQALPAQGYPAASPWATAVGGTVLSLDKSGARADEQAWAFSGGGSALFIPEPEWQKSEPHVDLPCLPINSDGAPQPLGTVCRGVPDIAALSGSATEAMYINAYDQPTGAGGTSLSSPLVMGAWSRVAAAARKPLGPAAPAIYHIDADKRAHDFFDVTAGEAVGNGLYVPGPGWDYNTGYGVPDIAKLTADLTGGTTPAHPAAAARVPDPPTGDKVACEPFGTSPTANVATDLLGDNGDTRDLTSAGMTLSPDGKSLVITVRGPHLAARAPFGVGGNSIRATWVYHGTTYVAEAAADPSGKVTGTLSTPRREDPLNPSKEEPKTTEFGAEYGSGSLTMTIPLSDIGSPKPGDRLQYPIASSGRGQGNDDVVGPTNDYTVGQRCH
jgi:subtilase family serine protease